MKRVAIVGCGGIAGTHAWALSKLKDVELVGFADILMDRAEDFRKRYGAPGARAFSSLTDLLREAKPEVVHICTPHYLHVPMAVEALEAGVDVFCEKPPAIDLEQFELLQQVESRGTARVGFCFQNRYNKTVGKAGEILKSGLLGKLLGARAFVTWRRDEDYYRTDWKGRLATEGGGALINQSIHSLDLLLYFLGKPETVKATLANHHLEGITEVEDTVEAWMSFADGERACFYASTAYAVDAPVILELHCEEGSMTLIEQTLTLREKGKAPEIITFSEENGVGKDYWGNGHLACIEDFYQALKSGNRFQNDLESVRNTMETMMKIYDYRERM